MAMRKPIHRLRPKPARDDEPLPDLSATQTIVDDDEGTFNVGDVVRVKPSHFAEVNKFVASKIMQIVSFDGAGKNTRAECICPAMQYSSKIALTYLEHSDEELSVPDPARAARNANRTPTGPPAPTPAPQQPAQAPPDTPYKTARDFQAGMVVRISRPGANGFWVLCGMNREKWRAFQLGGSGYYARNLRPSEIQVVPKAQIMVVDENGVRVVR